MESACRYDSATEYHDRYHEALESTKALSPALPYHQPVLLKMYHVTSSETIHIEEWGSAAGLLSY